MKKIFFSCIVIAMFSLTAQSAYSASFTVHSVNGINDDKNKTISIGTNRASGEMLLRFTANRSGKASISVLNATGEIVLQQTDQVTNSNNTIPLKNATQLPEGSYTVRLIVNNDTYSTRLLIWK